MTRDAQGTAVRLLVVGLGFRLDPVSPDLEGRGGGQAIQTIQARLWGGFGTAQMTKRTVCVSP